MGVAPGLRRKQDFSVRRSVAYIVYRASAESAN
jgi:hypothetical protein